MVEAGRFVWHELLTRDPGASRSFYGTLFGWAVSPLPGYAGPAYSAFWAGGQPIAGLVPLDPRDPRTPTWVGCVAVDDPLSAARGALASGGGVIIPPTALPGVGQAAVLSDPHGAPIVAWRGAAPDLPAISANEVFCWDELAVPTAREVLGFYQDVFGWSATPFTSGGAGWLFNSGGKQVASVLSNPGVPAHWLCHIVVDNLDVARSRVVQLGGRVEVAEQSVPGSGRFTVVSDNLGARFALFEPQFGPV